MGVNEALWRKASRSTVQNDNCVEVALWRKSSHSTAEGDNCVEIADTADIVAVRDSKDPDGPKLMVSRRDFRRLAEVLKAR